MSNIPRIHQQVYNSMPGDLKQFFYQHNMWQGVSCIRLKSGVMKEFVSNTNEGEQHSQTFLRAATTIVSAANQKNVWACVRFANDGYQSVLVYLGTRNIDEFIRLSKVRQGESRDRAEAEANWPDGILDEDGNPYGDR
jgi:hypothetical protein